MRRTALLLGAVALMASVTLPATAQPKHHHHKAKCGDNRGGYEVIFDGSRRCFERWRYAGGASMNLRRDGTIRSGPGAEGLGVLWYAARPYGDFSLKLQFRDDAPADRANSGIQVRFPAPHPPVPGCPTDDPGWVAVVCGHEVQINDSPDGEPWDPRKTGSIYGFDDLDSAASHPTPKGVWNDLEIRVVGQHYTIVRNGAVINEFDNPPDAPFPGRPDDPGSKSRGLVGYIGLQSHGGPNDVVSFRDIRIKDLSDRD
jgi:hypothetical protein